MLMLFVSPFFNMFGKDWQVERTNAWRGVLNLEVLAPPVTSLRADFFFYLSHFPKCDELQRHLLLLENF